MLILQRVDFDMKEFLLTIVFILFLLEISLYLVLIIIDTEIGTVLFALCITICLIISIIITSVFTFSLYMLLNETVQEMSIQS